MSNSGYDPYLDYMRQGGKKGQGSLYDQKPRAGEGYTPEAHLARLQKIAEDEKLAAMQAYARAGEVGAARAGGMRAQAIDPAAGQAATGGLASRLAMYGATGEMGEVTGEITEQQRAEREALMGGAIDAQAKRAEYELAALQASLAQRGILDAAGSRADQAQREADERERKQRGQRQSAVAGGVAGVATNTAAWAAESDDDDKGGW